MASLPKGFGGWSEAASLGKRVHKTATEYWFGVDHKMYRKVDGDMYKIDFFVEQIVI